MEGCRTASDKFTRPGADRVGLSFHVDAVMQGMLWMFGGFNRDLQIDLSSSDEDTDVICTREKKCNLMRK